MTPAIYSVLKVIADQMKHGKGLSICEVGSKYIPSQHNMQPRALFSKAKYHGIDLEAGEGVDEVKDATKMSMGFERYDLVLCMEVIEHVPAWWRMIEHCWHSLKIGGTFLCSTPNNGFPLHRHPLDCYRFLEDGFREGVMGWFHDVEVEELPDGNQSCWFGRGVK